MKDFNRNLNEENIEMTNEDFKTCFASYVIKKLQITATLILLHTCGQNPEHWEHQMLVWMRSNRNSCALLLRVQNGVVTLQDSLAVSYKTKHSLTTHFRYLTARCFTQLFRNLCHTITNREIFMEASLIIVK